MEEGEQNIFRERTKYHKEAEYRKDGAKVGPN